jgi:tRNA (guanine37-N1)-methyltransferase
MRIDVVTLHPDLLDSPLNHSIVKRAVDKGLVSIHTHNPRDYTTTKYKTGRRLPVRGGAGMVMMIEPIDKCLTDLKEQRTYDEIIYLSPDGELFNQKDGQ